MKKTIVSALALVMAASMSALATADSLENLERERALTVATMLDSTMDVEARWNKLNLSRVRLADLEVMVINDKSLKNSYSNRVKHALSNYEPVSYTHLTLPTSIQV